MILTYDLCNTVSSHRMVNYPLGLGDSRISVLVTDDTGPEPVVVTIYTLYINRDSRPSLPMFGDHVTCSFLQVSRLISDWLLYLGISCHT